MTQEKDEMQLSKEILDRLAPLMHRYLEKTLRQHGGTVSLSVAANISTSLMAYALTIVESHGGNVDEFVNVMMQETKNKFDSSIAELEATRLKIRLMAIDPSNYTCRPLH